MTRHYKKIFQTNPALLQEMLEERSQGKSLNYLGVKYHCDHSSVLHECQKAGVKPGVKVERILPKCKVWNCPNRVKTRFNKFCSQNCARKAKLNPALLREEEVIFEGEKINKGLDSYADYLRAEEMKKIKNKKWAGIIVSKGFLLKSAKSL